MRGNGHFLESALCENTIMGFRAFGDIIKKKLNSQRYTAYRIPKKKSEHARASQRQIIKNRQSRVIKYSRNPHRYYRKKNKKNDKTREEVEKKKKAVKAIFDAFSKSYYEKRECAFYIVWENVLFEIWNSIHKIFTNRSKKHFDLIKRFQRKNKAKQNENKKKKQNIKREILRKRNKWRGRLNKAAFSKDKANSFKEKAEIPKASLEEKFKKLCIQKDGKNNKKLRKCERRLRKKTKAKIRKTEDHNYEFDFEFERQLTDMPFKSVDLIKKHKKEKNFRTNANWLKQLTSDRVIKLRNKTLKRQKSPLITLKKQKTIAKKVTIRGIKPTLKKAKKGLSCLVPQEKQKKAKIEKLKKRETEQLDKINPSIKKIFNLLNDFSKKIETSKKPKMQAKTRKTKKKEIRKTKLLRQMSRRKKNVEVKKKHKKSKKSQNQNNLKKIRDKSPVKNEPKLIKCLELNDNAKESNETQEKKKTPKHSTINPFTINPANPTPKAKMKNSKIIEETKKPENNNLRKIKCRRDTYFLYYDDSENEEAATNLEKSANEQKLKINTCKSPCFIQKSPSSKKKIPFYNPTNQFQ